MVVRCATVPPVTGALPWVCVWVSDPLADPVAGDRLHRRPGRPERLAPRPTDRVRYAVPLPPGAWNAPARGGADRRAQGAAGHTSVSPDRVGRSAPVGMGPPEESARHADPPGGEHVRPRTRPGI